MRTSVCERGKEWHREIDAIIRKRKTEIDQKQIKFLTAVNKQLTAFEQTVDVAVQSIHNLKKLLHSYDVYAVSTYKTKNDSFRKLPPWLHTNFPLFSSNKIDTKYLQQQFGILSAFSFESQE